MGEEEHSVPEVPKGLRSIVSALPLESDGPGRVWRNMIILAHKELLRDYNPLQRRALRRESRGRLGES